MKKNEVRVILLVIMLIVVGGVSVWAFKGTMDIARATGGKTTTANKKTVKDASIDEKALEEKLTDDVKYDSKLSLVKDDVARAMISVDKDSDIKLYMGDGKSADTVIVIHSKDSSVAGEDQKVVKAYLSDMDDSFKDYLPKESKKINDAIVKCSGSYMVVCVTSDTDTAKKIVDGFF